MYCLSISSLCISVNVLSTRQSDETHLNNFPKDFKLPTFFSPFQRKCANLLRRHWSLYWQNSKRIILQEIVVFQIKKWQKQEQQELFPDKCCCGIKDEFFFFFFISFIFSSVQILWHWQDSLQSFFCIHWFQFVLLNSSFCRHPRPLSHPVSRDVWNNV